MACDPNVALLNFFHAVDETACRPGRAGSSCPDGTRRASYAAVKAAIHANQQCRGKTVDGVTRERVVGRARPSEAAALVSRSARTRASSYDVKISRPASTRRLTGASGSGRSGPGRAVQAAEARHAAPIGSASRSGRRRTRPAQRRSRGRSAAAELRTCLASAGLQARPMRYKDRDDRPCVRRGWPTSSSTTRWSSSPGSSCGIDGGTVAAPL